MVAAIVAHMFYFDLFYFDLNQVSNRSGYLKRRTNNADKQLSVKKIRKNAQSFRSQRTEDSIGQHTTVKLITIYPD